MAIGITMENGSGEQQQQPETPRQKVVRAGQSTTEVIDALGRKLLIKNNLDAITKMRLFQAAGRENCDNQQYIGMAALALAVTAIDGKPMRVPETRMQLEAYVAEVANEGIEAAADQQRNVNPELTNPQLAVDAAKN